MKFPAIEVRYRSLCVEAACEVVHGKAPLPTLWNSIKSMLVVSILLAVALELEKGTIKD